jgi:hypothetical protein
MIDNYADGIIRSMGDTFIMYKEPSFEPEERRDLGLCLNIVHTSLKNKQLQDNQVLLRQLNEILRNVNDPIHIQILLNGESAQSHFAYLLEEIFRTLHAVSYVLCESSTEKSVLMYDQVVITFYHNDVILPLGSARDFLADRGIYSHYINVDEDDELVNPTVVGNLIRAIPRLGGSPIAMFGFRWYYEKNGWLTYKDNPFVDGENYIWIEPDGKLQEPIRLRSMKGLCSWNFMHDADYYHKHGITRPPINRYDDCFFYNRLLDHFKTIPFIQLLVYAYHAERGDMSKEQDEYMKAVTTYINDQKDFIIDRIIVV